LPLLEQDVLRQPEALVKLAEPPLAKECIAHKLLEGPATEKH
jgi:hypothetical protein